VNGEERAALALVSTTLKGLIGEVRLNPEGECLMAEFELAGARLLAAADAKMPFLIDG
jgi:hypothetical protein